MVTIDNATIDNQTYSYHFRSTTLDTGDEIWGEIREISVIAMSPSHIVEMVLDEVEKQDKEAVKKENALLSQLCAGVITWDEFHNERKKIFGSSLI